VDATHNYFEHFALIKLAKLRKRLPFLLVGHSQKLIKEAPAQKHLSLGFVK
jgi:hypothetical protein